MKKLLLGLGTLSLAILPVAAMVSCSSTAPTLDTEAAKLNVSVATKDKTIKAWPAAKEINDAVGAPAKKTALEKIVVIPTLDSGFTIEVKSAEVNHTTHTQVDVTILVTQTAGTAGSNTKTAVLKVTGLATTPATFETEKTKFTTTVVTTTPIVEATAAVATITTSAQPAANLTALQAFATVPTPAAGFAIVVKSAAVNNTTASQVDVTIEVSETAVEANKAEVVFSVSGLATSTLAKQAALFTAETAKKGDTTLATEAIKLINTPTTQETKLAALQALATLVPTLAEGFTLEIKEATVDTANTSISVAVTITQTSGATGSNTVDAKLVITGFTAPSEPAGK